MPKDEWGTKRVCPTTGKRFYDLNRDPIVSPYTGEVVTLEIGKARSQVTAKAKPEKATQDEDAPAALEHDGNSTEVEIEDDLLEDDEDDDKVSLDDLADVASDEDES